MSRKKRLTGRPVGRPRGRTLTNHQHVLLSDDEANVLMLLCEAYGLEKSSLIRKLIREELRRHERRTKRAEELSMEIEATN